MTMKTYYIYEHRTKDTNELFYIGVGTGKRAYTKQHRNQLWKNIVAKHGYTAEIILDGFTNRDEAVKEEIRLQELNKPRACLTYGDGCLSIVSEETKTKISKALTGRSLSDQAKEKLRRANLGLKQSQSHIDNKAKATSKRIINCRGEEFESLKLAANHFKLHIEGISANLAGRAKSAGKYPDGIKIKWSYSNVNIR